MARTRTWITLRSTSRRGIAMMLVLVAMVVTVVLTSAAIVSRETSPAMGENAAALASTSWGAESAANYAVGVLAKGFDWESAIGPDGTFMDSMTVGAATVKVTLQDLEGNVPDAQDRDLIMIAVATVNGISTTVRRAISLGEPGDPMDALDLRMGEFAILGVADLTVEPGAKLGVWPLSPEATARPQLKMATAFASASNLSVSLIGALGPIEMHADASADVGIVSQIASAGYSNQWQMPVTLPILSIGVPSAAQAAMPGGGDFEPATNAVVALPGTKDYGRIRVRDGAVATIDGTVPVALRCDEFEVENGTIRIVGDVSIYVRDRVRVRNLGRIVMADPEAELRLIVCKDVELDGNAQVGVAESDAGRAAGALQTWIEPDRVQICEVDPTQGGSGLVSITVDDNSTLLASVHAPLGSFAVQSNSTLVGRVTGKSVRIGATATVLYDPTLDNRIGFSNQNSPLYADALTLNPIMEAALDDVASSGVKTIEGFLALLEVAYEDQRELALIGGVLEETTSAVQTTVHIFTGLLGIK